MHSREPLSKWQQRALGINVTEPELGPDQDSGAQNKKPILKRVSKTPQGRNSRTMFAPASPPDESQDFSNKKNVRFLHNYNPSNNSAIPQRANFPYGESFFRTRAPLQHSL